MVETAYDAMEENTNSNANALAANFIHLENSPERLYPTPEIPDVLEVSTLHQCFHTILLSRKVRISFPAYKYIVQHDLEIPEISYLNDSDVAVLAKIVNYFMTQWPGWIYRNTFVDGPTAVSTWFDDYRQFLKNRVLYVVSNLESTWETAISEHVKETAVSQGQEVLTDNCPTLTPNCVSSGQNEEENSDTKPNINHFECGVQTDQLDFATYHLAFSGQPAILNSLYFVITQQGHASARFHNILKLESISTKQLLNSPYVSVNVTLPEISFGRKMDHKFTRFISTRSLKKGTPSTDPKITYIKHLDTSKYDTYVYSYEFLKQYFEQFFIILKKHKLVIEGRIKELETIVQEFLNDILDCNLYDNTMATNISVTFRLGGHRYVRNKVWRRTNVGSISYVERIDPRATFFLKSLSAEQDTSTTEPSFTLLNKIDRALHNKDTDNPELIHFLEKLHDDQNYISYSCILCEKVFSYYKLLYKHYSAEHGGEQAILCDLCGEKQNMVVLTTKRWEHQCCREVPKHEPVNSMSSIADNSVSANCNAVDDASSTYSGTGSFLNGLMKEELKLEDISMEIVVEDTFVNGGTVGNEVLE